MAGSNVLTYVRPARGVTAGAVNRGGVIAVSVPGPEGPANNGYVDAQVAAVIATILGTADTNTNTLGKLAALISANTTALNTILGGANPAVDTFIEAYNRFLADESAAGAVNTALASLQTAFAAHAADTSNPHSVTKAQVGLGNVDDTSDADKPVSTAQAAADSAVQAAAATDATTKANAAQVAAISAAATDASTKANNAQAAAIAAAATDASTKADTAKAAAISAAATDATTKADAAQAAAIASSAASLNSTATAIVDAVTTDLAGKADVSALASETARAQAAEVPINTSAPGFTAGLSGVLLAFLNGLPAAQPASAGWWNNGGQITYYAGN